MSDLNKIREKIDKYFKNTFSVFKTHEKYKEWMLKGFKFNTIIIEEDANICLILLSLTNEEILNMSIEEKVTYILLFI